MKKLFAAFFLFFLLTANLTIADITKSSDEELKITIIYDNYSAVDGLKSEWGFSCLIEGKEKTILFDTGGDPDVFMHNLNKLNIDPKKVDVIVISHEHWDHIGGLTSFLERNPDVTIYLLSSYSDSFIDKAKALGSEVVFADQSKEICKDIYTTGMMGTSMKEQSLLINNDIGTIIISGCSHQGIVNILHRAKELINNKIYLSLGGYHLLRQEKSQVASILNEFEKLQVEKCGATHCTGDEQIKMFKEAFADNYVEVGSGKVLIFTKEGLK